MLAVIAHDAGGAEILSSYVRREKTPCRLALAGPALKVFERKLGPIETIPLERAVSEATSVLCGTGWQSDFEFSAVKLARRLGKPVTSYIDHWVNYRERFVRGGETYLPNEIWVGDPDALALAGREFPETPVRLVANPYFEDMKAEVEAEAARTPRAARAGREILYICEPVRDPSHYGYTEVEPLRYLLANAAALDAVPGRVVLRLHPSEAPGKYDWAVAAGPVPVVMGGATTLAADLARADLVAGCNSAALVVGTLVGKRVVTCIPPGGKPCALPQAGVERLQEIVSAQAGRA